MRKFILVAILIATSTSFAKVVTFDCQPVTVGNAPNFQLVLDENAATVNYSDSNQTSNNFSAPRNYSGSFPERLIRYRVDLSNGQTREVVTFIYMLQGGLKRANGTEGGLLQVRGHDNNTHWEKTYDCSH